MYSTLQIFIGIVHVHVYNVTNILPILNARANVYSIYLYLLSWRNDRLNTFFLKDYERRITDMEDAREKALQELTEHYQAKLQEKEVQLDQASDEQRQQLRESEELQRQTEEDADREILDLKNRYERQLRQRWEENTKLRGEVGILSKKVSTIQATS